MKCLSRGNIQAYWDDELDSSQKADVTRHFRECPRCRALGDELQLNREFFQSKSSNLDLEISQRILHAWKSTPVRPWLFRPLPVPASLLALTAILVVLMGSVLVSQNRKLSQLRSRQPAENAQRIEQAIMTARVLESLAALGKRVDKLVYGDRSKIHQNEIAKGMKTMKKAKNNHLFFSQIVEQLKEV